MFYLYFSLLVSPCGLLAAAFSLWSGSDPPFRVISNFESAFHSVCLNLGGKCPTNHHSGSIAYQGAMQGCTVSMDEGIVFIIT